MHGLGFAGADRGPNRRQPPVAGAGVAVAVLVGEPVGVGVAVAELLAEEDGVGDGELDGIGGSELGVAGAVTVEEGSGEPAGTGVPVGEGWLVCDAVTSTGAAGGGAAASAIPAVIVAMPTMAPSPSSTGIQGNACFVPDSGPSAVTRCLPVVRPTHRSSARW